MALFKPHVGIYAYTIMSIMAPQYIWPWVFEGIPAFTIVAGSTLLAFGLALVAGKLDLSVYKHRQHLLLLIVWAFFHLSIIFTPFQSYSAFAGSDLVIGTLNTIIIMYFVSLPLLAKAENLKVISFLFIGIFIYYVYWSNEAYFSFDISRFSISNRLYGPWGSSYRDENMFATFFIVGMPFLLFGIALFKSLFLKVGLSLCLLFSLHSIILTGSRGALVATVVMVVFSYFLIKTRLFRVILVAGFLGAVIYQGGQMLNRTTSTIDVAKEGTEEPIDPRIVSWTIGFELIKKYPLLGVGTQRFQEASRIHFPYKKAQVAHNTFICFAANTGLITGFIFLYFYYLHFKNFRFAVKNQIAKEPLLNYFNNVFIVSLTGFYVCSIFLDLIIFEAFYFLLLLNFMKDKLFRQALMDKDESETSGPSKNIAPKINYRSQNA